jgi:YD repeat-containing protein
MKPYDGAGALKSVVTPTRRIDYVYDAFGRRIGKIVDGTLQRGWVYQDELRPVAQLVASGQIEATFVYATQVNVPEYMVARTTGRVYRLLTDQRGSVRLVVDVGNGTVVQRMDYDEFGKCAR